MAVFKTKFEVLRGKNNTAIPSKIFSMNLSMGAIGLFSYIVSFPEETDFSIESLVNSVESLSEVKEYIKELESSGCLLCEY